MTEKKAIDALWPDVSTLDGAHEAATEGAKAAFAVALLTLVFSLYAMYRQPGYNITPRAIVDILLFSALAVGTLRMSRITAGAALALYILERVYQIVTVGPGGLRGVLLMLFISYFLFQGVRGTFGHHRLIKEQSVGGETAL